MSAGRRDAHGGGMAHTKHLDAWLATLTQRQRGLLAEATAYLEETEPLGDEDGFIPQGLDEATAQGVVGAMVGVMQRKAQDSEVRLNEILAKYGATREELDALWDAEMDAQELDENERMASDE